MRSQIAQRFRSSSSHPQPVPPALTSDEYSFSLAKLAAQILYPSPLPSPNDLPLYILDSAALPDTKAVNYDFLLPYILARLPDENQLQGGQCYEVIFFAGGAGKSATGEKKARPGWGWCVQAYHVLTRAMRKRLQRLYILHEGGWIRLMVEMFGAVVSPKFRKKVVHVSTISSLTAHLPIEDLLISPSAYLADRGRSPHIHPPFTPYAKGRRAFGVGDPLPISSDGSLRLPRILRETTSFLITQPLIKTEGIFRINAKAITVEILKEAYDRGQKFIIWKDGETLENPIHFKEGYGNVSVDEPEIKEGYDVHTAGALLKQWYKDLREPIFPPSCYPAIRQSFESSLDPLDPLQLRLLLSPENESSALTLTARFILTMHLLPLLGMVADHQESNRMTPTNLAVCFTPTLLRGPDPQEDYMMSQFVQGILEASITHWKRDLVHGIFSSTDAFHDLLRTPEAVADREDPLQEGPLPTEDAIFSRIALEDNESNDTEKPPPLPPRRGSTPPTHEERDQSPVEGARVRRKPAPPLHALPRYSMIVDGETVWHNATQHRNTVAEEGEESDGVDDGEILPPYEEMTAMNIARSPAEDPMPEQSEAESSVARKPVPSKGQGSRS